MCEFGQWGQMLEVQGHTMGNDAGHAN